MYKVFTKLLIGVLAVFLFAGVSYAAGATSIRLQQPKTPTSQDTFNITFVALDTNSSQPVSVQCYKKGPTDGGFSAFGSVKNLSNGGNTGVCEVNSGVINEGNGTYNFYAQVVTGSTTPTSSTVSVDFNNSSAPGTPTNYSKEKTASCTYKFSFKTADDSGKTTKVVLYRSDTTSFGVDSAHQVNTTNIGSNTNGDMSDNVPDCNATYYYVIRSFDVYGNGSGVVGDQNVTITTVAGAQTTSESVQTAIPVGQGGESAIRGAAGEEGGNVLGTKSAKESQTPANTKSVKGAVSNLINWVSNHRGIVLILFLAVILSTYAYLRYYKK